MNNNFNSSPWKSKVNSSSEIKSNDKNETINISPYIKRVDDIFTKISQYRKSQEFNLLASSNSQIQSSHSKLSGLVNQSTQGNRNSNSWIDQQTYLNQENELAIVNSKLIIQSKNSIDSSDFLNLLNRNVLIVSRNITTESLWPLALVVAYPEISEISESVENVNNCNSNYSVDLGSLDSHGSLWKLIKRIDSFPGTRVVLQATEFGETLAYLGVDLQLKYHIDDAAVWNIFLIPEPTNESKGSSCVKVRLEYFESYRYNSSNARTKPRHLMAVTSKDKQYGVAILTEEEMQMESNNLSFSIQWEILEEDNVPADEDLDIIFNQE